jgi:hypothetical protein
MVDRGAVAEDEAALLEALDPLVDGGGGQARRLAQVRVGHPSVPREQLQDLSIHLLDV